MASLAWKVGHGVSRAPPARGAPSVDGQPATRPRPLTPLSSEHGYRQGNRSGKQVRQTDGHAVMTTPSGSPQESLAGAVSAVASSGTTGSVPRDRFGPLRPSWPLSALRAAAPRHSSCRRTALHGVRRAAHRRGTLGGATSTAPRGRRPKCRGVQAPFRPGCSYLDASSRLWGSVACGAAAAAGPPEDSARVVPHGAASAR